MTGARPANGGTEPHFQWLWFLLLSLLMVSGGFASWTLIENWFYGAAIRPGPFFFVACGMFSGFVVTALAFAFLLRHIPTLAERNRTGQEPSRATISPRVLLVEDNIVNQRVARLQLEKLGCRVDIAANGREAVEMVRGLRYDLVFMDCQMPVMDGYEATRAIREREGSGFRLPIVAMTAHAMGGDKEKCLEAGMDDYIVKPVRRDLVAAAIERWVTGNGEQSPAAARGNVANGDIDSEMAANLQAFEEEGGREFVVDLVAGFLRNARERVASLHGAVAGNDLAAARQLAHDLKGSAATLGARTMARISRDIEVGAELSSIAEGAELVAQLEKQLDRLETALAPYRET